MSSAYRFHDKTITENEIKKNFECIKNDVFGVLLFGSAAKGEHHGASDIDICLVNPKNKNVLIKALEKVGDKYDVKIFEDLPLYVQIDIIRNHKVVYGNEVELSYYFYKFRKIWNDQKERIQENQFKSAKEMINSRRRWLNEKAKIS